MANQADRTLMQTLQLDRLVQFLKEVRGEVARVTWPGGDEVKGATWVVIVVCVFVAFIIWVIDKIISFGVDIVF